jgi:hypothetical protein
LRLNGFTNKHQQLRKAKDELEAWMKIRTAELAAANASLQKKNLEKTQVESNDQRPQPANPGH